MESSKPSLIPKEGTVDGQKFILLLKLELLKDNHEALKALIKKIHRRGSVSSVFASLDFDAKKLFLKILVEPMKEYQPTKEYQVISSKSVKYIKGLNDDRVEPYEQLCEILIKELIWAEDVKEIRKRLDYWFPEGLSFSDLDITASDVGSPLMRAIHGGSKKQKPDEVCAIRNGFASEQAFDVNEIHKRPYCLLSDGSPFPVVGVPSYYLNTVTRYATFEPAVFSGATTIQIKQDLNDPDLEYLCETDGGSKKGKPGKFKLLMLVGLAAAGIFIVNMSLAESGFPEHWILIGACATLPPLLALIKKAFSSNASE